MKHGTIDDKVRRRHLAILAELLLMPNDVRVEEEFFWEFFRHRLVRIQDNFPELTEVAWPAHTRRKLESVRAALREVIGVMRKEMPLLIAALDEFAFSCAANVPETRHPG